MTHTTIRSVERIFSPPPRHWVGDGFYVHNFIPGVGPLSMQRMDPFILLDYNAPHYFPPNTNAPGVGVHPHRGFETVTLAFSGSVAHHDSAGNAGVIHPGDVQWMTAASGVLHKEYHERQFHLQGGAFHMVQLWVNLPAKYKMSEPRYQSITASEMGRFDFPSGNGSVTVVAGHYGEVKGPARTFTPVNLFVADLNEESAEFSFPVHYHTAVLVLKGTVVVNDHLEAHADQFVLMANDGEKFKLSPGPSAQVLVLSGEPINESIAAYGPFVMNSRQEIIDAYSDLQQGKFGELED